MVPRIMLRIACVTTVDEGAIIEIAGAVPVAIEVEAAWLQEHNPVADGWLVIEEDGVGYRGPAGGR